MRRLFTVAGLFALAALLAAAPLAAESHSFKLNRYGTLNGASLEPGVYKLELNGQGEAMLYRGKTLVTKARVEVKPLERATPNTIVQDGDGAIREIRLSNKVVVFVR